MKAIAKVLANHIAMNTKEPVSANVLAYALEALLGEIGKIVTFAMIGWLLNCFVEMIIVVGTYIILRTATGGPHCTSYMRCFVVGGLFFIPLALFASTASAQIVAPVIMMTCLFTAFGIFRWVPGEWHQRKLRKPKEMYQNTAIIMIIIIHVLATMFLITGQTPLLRIALALQLATLWQFISISPLGYKLIPFMDQFMIQIFKTGREVKHDEA